MLGIRRMRFPCCYHRMQRSISPGFSKYDFRKLENRAIVAPSMMRWSADQLTHIICFLITFPFSSKRGRVYKNIQNYSQYQCNHILRYCYILKSIFQLIGVFSIAPLAKQTLPGVCPELLWPPLGVISLVQHRCHQSVYRSNKVTSQFMNTVGLPPKTGWRSLLFRTSRACHGVLFGYGTLFSLFIYQNVLGHDSQQMLEW